MKVWVLFTNSSAWDGDFAFLGVFSSKEKAEEASNKFSDNDCEIQEFELDKIIEK